jgi:hypothetical protein
MNKQTQLEVADVLASQLNENIKKLNIADEDKSVLLGTIARLIQLTSSISSQAPPTYECIINIWGDDGKAYKKSINLPYVPNKHSPCINLGIFLINPDDIVLVSYGVATNRFLINQSDNKVIKTKTLLAAGFKEA